MNKFHCVIIDSKSDSVNHLKGIIELNPLLSIVGIYTDPVKALFDIQERDNIHFLFIDIEMKELLGLELAKRLSHKVKFIVFITPNNLNVLKKIDMDSNQYLIKPVNQLKLIQMVHQLAYPHQINIDDNLFIERKTKGSFDRLIKGDIVLIQNKINSILIVTEIKNISVNVNFSDALKEFENDLRFLQLDNSYLINLNFVTSISTNELTFKNGSTISILI